MNKDSKKVLEAQKYMYENITGQEYSNSKHLLNLLGILGNYPIPKCTKKYRIGDAK